MKTKVVIIDDKLILGLLHDSRFLNIFPEINKIVMDGRDRLVKSIENKACKKCNAALKQRIVDAMSVKKKLASLSADDKVKLKDFLNTEQVKIVFKSKEGRIIQIDY
jgi:hypothetical protein